MTVMPPGETSPADALGSMLLVPGGGPSVVEWLQRLPGVVRQPGRRRRWGADEPDTVLVGSWRVGPTRDGVLAELVSGGVTVQSRAVTGLPAGALLAEVIAQHAAQLPRSQQEEIGVEIAVLQEIAAAGR